MLEDLFIFLSMILTVVVAGFIIACLGSATVAPAQCSSLGAAMKVKTDYYFWKGCFITLPNGETVPEDVALKIMQQKYQINVE